jgi:hypothetical protein
MPWRDRLDDPPPHDFIRQLAVAPLADRSTRVRWLLAGQGNNLAYLLRRELRRATRSLGIGQPLGHASSGTSTQCVLARPVAGRS